MYWLWETAVSVWIIVLWGSWGLACLQCALLAGTRVSLRSSKCGWGFYLAPFSDAMMREASERLFSFHLASDLLMLRESLTRASQLRLCAP